MAPPLRSYSPVEVFRQLRACLQAREFLRAVNRKRTTEAFGKDRDVVAIRRSREEIEESIPRTKEAFELDGKILLHARKKDQDQ